MSETIHVRREPSPAERAAMAVRAELNAMTAIVEAFEAMPDPEARARVMRYLHDRYDAPRPPTHRAPAAARPSEAAP